MTFVGSMGRLLNGAAEGIHDRLTWEALNDIHFPNASTILCQKKTGLHHQNTVILY